MKRLGVWLIGGLVVLGAAGAVFGEDSSPTSTPRAENASARADAEDETEVSESTAEAPEPDPEPRGKFGLASCDLGGDDALIGSTEVMNTGEVPAKVAVSFKWQLGDGSWLKANNKTTSLRPGAEKLVFFTIPADIDTQLSFQDHPGYFDSSNCKTKAIIS